MSVIWTMPVLQAALDAESFEFVAENYPELVDAVGVELRNGASPEAIGRFVTRLTQRPALALRLEQAARHLQTAEA